MNRRLSLHQSNNQMATSLFFMSANPSATNDDMSGPKMVVVPASENARTDPLQRQPRSRRPSNKTPAPIKQRRRGLGVAELERLSSQERMKRMAEIPPFSAGQFFTAPGLQYCMTATTSPPASPFPGTARGFVVPVSSGYVTGGRAVGSPYGQLVGAPVVLAEAASSRELTSMPNNVLQQQQQCSVLSCSSTSFKKNEIIKGGSVSGMITGLDRAKSGETRVKSSSTRKKLMDSNNGGDFLELNLGNYNHGHGGSAVNCCDGINTHSPVLEKEVEVMAVRRKVKKNNSSSVVLEYEFFPGKQSNNYTSSLPQEQLNNIHHHNSSSSSSYAPHSSSSSSYIDLSLKLSYNNNNNY